MKTSSLKNNQCYMIIIIQIALAYYGNKLIILQLFMPLLILLVYKKDLISIKEYITKIINKKLKKEIKSYE